MKLTFKPGKRPAVLLAVAALAVIAVLMSRSGGDEPPAGGMDAAAQRACDDFADGYPEAGSRTERITLADEVMTSSRKTGNDAIADRGTALGGGAGGTAAEWKSSADRFTAACRAAGWTAR